MPTLKHDVPYSGITAEQCAAKLKAYGERLLDGHSMVVEWQGLKATFSGAVLGRGIEGHLVVGSEEVKTVTTIPLLAVPFKGKIRDGITEHITKALSDDPT